MLKRKKHQDEKEKGVIQKIKEMDKDILIRIGAFVAVILLVTVFAFIKVHKKGNPELIRIKDQNTEKQKTIVKEKSDVELILNETYRLNKDNFEIYISKKNESKGVIFLRPSDFIKNNNKLTLSDSVSSLIISGNPDILSHLSWSISKKYYTNINNGNINITLDNSYSKSELLFKIDANLISKEEIISDTPLINIRYIESYAD